MTHYIGDFSAYRAAFEGYTFCHSDFEHLALEPGDFVYADPPYHSLKTHPVYGHPFGWEQQVRLAERLATHNGPVIASNANNRELRKVYRALGFRLKTVMAPRNNSCTAAGRGKVAEMLAFKNL